MTVIEVTSHGSSGYNQGCRCEVCAAAMAARKKRQRERANPTPLGTMLAARPGWQDQAECRGVDPDLFFPERGASTRESKQICQDCPVRVECLAYAIDNAEKFGIWGGRSERERRRMRRTANQRVAC